MKVRIKGRKSELTYIAEEILDSKPYVFVKERSFGIPKNQIDFFENAETVEVPSIWIKGLIDKVNKAQRAKKEAKKQIAYSELLGYTSTAVEFIKEKQNQ